jgi:lysozyme
VSEHQGDIDWRAARDDGVAFAYIKATEGGDFVDHRLSTNWQGTAAAGIAHGAYHFFTFCSPGAIQADNFLRTVPNDPDALAPAVDLELAGNCAARPDRDHLLHELQDFITRVESATGRTVVLYVLDDVEAQYRVSEAISRPVWVRHLFTRPAEDRWQLWQASGWGRVAGIEGSVDLDVTHRT